jgi:hypothetical protein
VSKKVVLPLSQNWDMVTTAHAHICIGIQRSGPSCGKLDVSSQSISGLERQTRFEINWDGSSAHKKARRKAVLPKLKSAESKHVCMKISV